MDHAHPDASNVQPYQLVRRVSMLDVLLISEHYIYGVTTETFTDGSFDSFHKKVEGWLIL